MGIVAAAVTAVAGFLGGLGGIGAGIGSIFAKLVVNQVLGSIFSSKPKAPSFGDNIDPTLSRMVRQAITERQIVYGEVKKSGPIIYLGMTDNNQFLNLVVALASHHCNSIDKLFFDDEEISWNKTTGELTGKYQGYGWAYTKNGEDNQTAMQQLIDNTGGDFTTNHRLRGICYIYVRLKWNNELFSDIPNVSVLMKGKTDILDPRNGTTGFTSNAALCMLDYLTNSRLGLGITASEWDTTNMQEAANTCEELVPLKAGGTERRYTCVGVVDTSRTVQENIDDLLSTMAGQLTYRNGKFYLLPGEYRTPTVTITNKEVIGNINVSTRLSRQELYNTVKGVYVSPQNQYQASDYPVISVPSYVTEDGGEKIFRELNLPFTSSAPTAQRVARILLERNRRQISVTMRCNMKAFQLAVGDTVQVTDPDFGWTNKTFEVIAWDFDPSGESGLTVELGLLEIDSNVYAWTPASDETDVPAAPSTNLPNPFVIDTAPTNVTVESGTNQLRLKNDGTIEARMRAQWDLPTDAFVRSGGFAEISYKKVTETNFEQSVKVDGVTNFAIIPNVTAGDQYDVRVRFQNSLGAYSGSVNVSHTVIGKTAKPSNVPTFNVIQITDDIVTFTWTQVSDLDIAGYEIRYGVVGQTWGELEPLTISRKGTTSTEAQVPPSSTLFCIKAVDTSGNRSQTATCRQINLSNSRTIIAQLNENTSFSGTFDRCHENEAWGTVTPDDTQVACTYGYEMFEKTVPNSVTECTYTTPEIDLGSNQTARVWVDFMQKAGTGEGDGEPNIRFQLSSRADGSGDPADLSGESIILSSGTFTNCHLHHTGKLIPNSTRTAASYGYEMFDLMVPDPYATCEYEAPERDFGSDVTLIVTPEYANNIGQGHSGPSNVNYQIDYRTNAGAYDGFETTVGVQVTGRFLKQKFVFNNTSGVSYIDNDSLSLSNFQDWVIGQVTNARYLKGKFIFDNTSAASLLESYTINVDQ